MEVDDVVRPIVAAFAAEMAKLTLIMAGMDQRITVIEGLLRQVLDRSETAPLVPTVAVRAPSGPLKPPLASPIITRRRGNTESTPLVSHLGPQTLLSSESLTRSPLPTRLRGTNGATSPLAPKDGKVPISEERMKEIKKLLSEDSVTLHFMSNYKKIAILHFEKSDTLHTVKQRLRDEIIRAFKDSSAAPLTASEIGLSTERVMVRALRACSKLLTLGGGHWVLRVLI